MKRFSCMTLLGASLLLYSCSDDAPTADNNAIPDKFSSKSVEENKAQLEDNGIKLIQSLEGLRDAEGIDAVANLASLMDAFGGSEDVAVPAGRVIKSLARVSTDPKSATKVFSAMRLNGDVPSGEPESIQDAFDIYAGTYTWQAATDEWDFVDGSGSIIFKFPSEDGSTSNDATLTIRDYKGVAVTIDDYTGDLPTNLAMDLTVGGAKLMEYSFSAAYNGSNDPTSLQTSLTIASYVFKVDFTNTTTEVGVNYSLKNGSETLIAAGGSSTGKYAIDDLVEEEGEDVDTEDVIESASAYFQIYNIKIAGNVDVKSIAAGLDAIESDSTLSEEEWSEKEAELFNKHYQLAVFYDDSKEKIADTEFYSFVDTDTYSYWDGTSEQTVTYTDHEVGLRFVFADGSPVDFETYFDTGFSEIEAEFEAFYDAM